MSNPNLDDYLQQGMYGSKETKPEERRQFLGTLRERVVVALKQSQVREDGVYNEVKEVIKNNAGAKLFLNGHLDYAYLSKYIKIADGNKMEYTIVTNKNYVSEIGLLVAYDHAIDKEEIYISNMTQENDAAKEEKKGFFSSLGSFFKK
ncbi:YueI family protein [Niallia sp. 01092]|uniref:YueI family protein n=1 Tax=unclassified Niallia TaxID=2837522 RepID=UPI003FD5E2EF